METTPPAPPVVDLRLRGPQPQRRATVFFRWILAIPHLLYLAALGVAGWFAVVAAWFVALLTGRLPDGLRLFVARVINQFTRVHAYAQYLLTDRYPPFALDQGDYDAELLLPPATRLNRAAVLFRVVIGIPALIVVQVLSSGVWIVLFFVWVVVLVRGRMPASVFGAMAAILRYQARAYAWFVLLTPEYPRGLFGDRPDAAPPDDAFAFEPPSHDPAPEPRITRLVLTTAAKRIVVLVLVLGAVWNLFPIVTGAFAPTDRAVAELEAAHDDLDAAATDFASQAQSCALGGGAVCLDAEIERFSDALDDFLDDLREIEMPESALSHAAELEERGELLQVQLAAMAAAEDQQDYLAAAEAFQLHARGFDRAYERLHRQLLFA